MSVSSENDSADKKVTEGYVRCNPFADITSNIFSRPSTKEKAQQKQLSPPLHVSFEGAGSSSLPCTPVEQADPVSVVKTGSLVQDPSGGTGLVYIDDHEQLEPGG